MNDHLSARLCASVLVLAMAGAACAGNRARPGARTSASPNASGSAATASPGMGPAGAGPGGAGSPGAPGASPGAQVAGGGGSPGASPSYQTRTAVPARTRPMTVGASVAPACVEPTSTATLKVHTDAPSIVAAQVYYAGGKGGPSTTKRTDASGDLTWTWVITIGTPVGDGFVEVTGSAFDGGHGNTRAPFRVVAEGQHC